VICLASIEGRIMTRNQCCNVCEELLQEDEHIKIECGHYFCKTCFAYCMVTSIENWLGVDLAVRFSCPGVSGGKRCNFSVDVEMVYNILFTHKDDPKVEKSFQRLDSILLLLYIRAFCTELRLCPKCRSGYASTCESDVKGEVTCGACEFKFCPYCDGAMSVHKDKSCAQLATEAATSLDKSTPTCPACRILVEKDGGCDHIQCKNCGYDWCYKCRGPYYHGHLDEHAVSRITVNVPGEHRPLQITQTPHTVYRLSQNDTSSTVKPSTLAGDDIPKLFQEHNVVKLVRIATKDPTTGTVTYKEGILLKRKRQSYTDTPNNSSGDTLEDENAKKEITPTLFLR